MSRIAVMDWFWSATFLLLPAGLQFNNCDQFKNIKLRRHVAWVDLETCLSVIGRDHVEKTFAEKIWELVKEVHEGIENIPTSVYKKMGNLLVGVPVDDLRNITMDNVDVIEAFNSIILLDSEKMSVLHEKILTEWGSKTPEKYSQYDLISLGQILCCFNITEIMTIHPDAYKNAAEEIGNIRNCPKEVIQAFARLAVQPEAFGDPRNWSKFDVTAVGNIITGLTPEEYASINPENLYLNRRVYNTSAYVGTPAKSSLVEKIFMRNGTKLNKNDP